MLAADRALVCTEQPALHKGGDTVHSLHEHVRRVRRSGLVDDQMIVAEPRQAGVATPSVREDTGARLDGLFHEGPQGVATDVGHPAQANAT